MSKQSSVTAADKLRFMAWVMDSHPMDGGQFKILFAVVECFLGMRGGKPHNAKVKMAALAMRCRMSMSAARRALDRLEELDLIKVTSQAGREGYVALHVPGVVGAVENLKLRSLKRPVEPEPDGAEDGETGSQTSRQREDKESPNLASTRALMTVTRDAGKALLLSSSRPIQGWIDPAGVPRASDAGRAQEAEPEDAAQAGGLRQGQGRGGSAGGGGGMSRLESYSAAIEDVIVLLRTGRVGMALTVLEGLTGLVDGELMAAMAAGHAMGRRGEPLFGGKKALKRPSDERHDRGRRCTRPAGPLAGA